MQRSIEAQLHSGEYVKVRFMNQPGGHIVDIQRTDFGY